MSLRDTTDDENRPFSRESAMALRATTGDENGGRESVRWRDQTVGARSSRTGAQSPRGSRTHGVLTDHGMCGP